MHPFNLAAAAFCCTILRESLTAGTRIRNVNDPEIQHLAKEAIKQINAQSLEKNWQGMVRVISARTEQTEMSKVRLSILTQLTDCNKHVPDTSECKFKSDAPEKICTVSIANESPQNTGTIEVHLCLPVISE